MHRIRRHDYELELELPISFHDTDAMGVIWHGNYLKFFEIARERLFYAHGVDYAMMRSEGYAFPVTEEKLSYRRIMTIDDKVMRVRAYVEEICNRVKIGYEAFNPEGKLCCYGYTVQAAVSERSRELEFEIPPFIRDRFPLCED